MENIRLRRLVARTLSEQQKTPSTTSFSASFGPHGFFPLCHWRDCSPGRTYVSDVWSLARSHNDSRLPRPPFARASGLPASLPSVTDMTSPQGEYTSPTFGRSLSHRTAEDSLDHLFCASFGRTHNEGGGLLPPGRAARISLFISDLGIFRVTKTITLISVKQLIHSHLKVALQNAETLTFCFHVNLFLRFSWAKVRNQQKTR